MRSIKGMFFCFIVGTLLQVAVAATDMQTLQTFVSQEKYHDAYQLAEKIKLKYEGNIQFDYCYGLAAARTEHNEQATFIFDRILAIHPHDPRTQLEYGLVQFKLKNYSAAKEIFARVIKAHPPEPVQKNIGLILKLMQDPSSVSGRKIVAKVKMVAGVDSNANASPTESVLSIPLLGLVRLNQSARAAATLFAQVQPELAGVMPLNNKTQLFGAINANLRDNFQAHTFDMRSFALTGGVNFLYDKFSISLPINYQRDYGASSLFSEATTAILQVMRPLDKVTTVGGFASVGQTSFPGLVTVMGTHFRNRRTLMGGAIWQTKIPYRVPLESSAKIYAGKEIPRTAGYTFLEKQFMGIEDNIRWQFKQDYTPFVSMRWLMSTYGNRVPGFIETRRDKELGLGCGMEIKINSAWLLAPTYAYQRNFSNTSIYRYSKHSLLVGLTYTNNYG